MKIRINGREHDLADGARMADVVRLVREANAGDPVLKSLREKTGDDHLTFLLGGRVLRAEEREALALREGDEIRWIHPAFGG